MTDDFARRLALLLEWKGISQAELARRCGVTRAAVHGWITGKTRPRQSIDVVAHGLEMTVVEFCAADLRRVEDELRDRRRWARRAAA